MLCALAVGATAVAMPMTSLRSAAGATDHDALAGVLDRFELSDAASLIDRDVHVERLLDLGCDLDTWSTGLHSYGKTPIFYAITRCRNEVVELLLARGARTRIVNNKGQSVLSLAATHLSESVVRVVEQHEAAEDPLPEAWLVQLASLPPTDRSTVREESGWVDFRLLHSDDQEYGDLDPRFCVAGPTDVANRLVLNPTSRSARRLHKHMPGSRSLALFPPRERGDNGGASPATQPRDATLGEAAQGDGGDGAGGDGGSTAEWPGPTVDRRARPPPAAAAGTAEVGPAGRSGAATPRAELLAALNDALAPLEAMLDASLDPTSAPPTARAVAKATDHVVSAMHLQRGAWLQAAALRIGRVGADPRLLAEAAAVAGEAGGEAGGAAGAGLRHRMLLQAAAAPSEAAATAAVATAEAAAAEAGRARTMRDASHSRAEGRRNLRVSALAPVPAPAPPTVWVDDVAGLAALADALGRACRVGIDSEWADPPGWAVGAEGAGAGAQLAGGALIFGSAGSSVGCAVIATVQLAVVDECGERAFVCDALLGGAAALERCAAGDAPAADGLAGSGLARSLGPLGLAGGPSLGPAAERLEYARGLAALLRPLLLSPGPPRAVGFAFAADAQKLALWLDAAEGADAGVSGGAAGGAAGESALIRAGTIDVQSLAEEAGLGSRAQAPSLRATCAHWLAHELDKGVQTSDWAVRPLSAEQLRYAATDASACLRVLAAMELDWGVGAEVEAVPLLRLPGADAV